VNPVVMETSAARGAGRAVAGRRAVWEAHLHRCRASGLSLSAYAKRHGLGLSTLCGWQAPLRAEGLIEAAPAPSFVRVEPAATPAEPAELGGSYRLVFPSGLVLQWQGAADLRLIGQLLHLWAAPR
jgi:hypothetical protein